MAAYNSIAWLWTNRLQDGIAHATVDDGTRAIVQRLDDGTWRCVWSGVETTGFATAGEAISRLSSDMRAGGIFLRLRG